MSALSQLEQNNYLIVDDFISVDRAKMLYETFKSDCKNYPQYFIKDNQCPKSMSIYDYRWFVELLVEKTPFMAEVLEQPMLPTYSYARLYSHNDELVKHTDRPACECSVTVHIGSDGTDWDIGFTKPDGNEVTVNLKPGQAIIYLGCRSVHWRDKFKGQEYGQIFLHYVKARGENWVQYFDKLKQ